MLLDILTRVTAVVFVMVVLATPLVFWVERIRRSEPEWNRLHPVGLRLEWRSRVSETLPVAVVLIAVLWINRVVRQDLPAISEQYGIRMTWAFYELEGEGATILAFERVATTGLTQFFSFIYIYAYVFLLVFPVILYVTLADTRPLRRLLTAYTVNYAIGVCIYVLVHAYGPRNILAGELEHVLYEFRPRYQHLTGDVNHNTNVFPSLHTSLAATVAIFAYRTRETFLLWTPIAVFLAVCVAISTMYLAIHWAIDVVAGLVLAAVAVWLADQLVSGPRPVGLVRRLTE